MGIVVEENRQANFKFWLNWQPMAIINYITVMPVFMHQHVKALTHQNIISIKRSNKIKCHIATRFIKRQKWKRKLWNEKEKINYKILESC